MAAKMMYEASSSSSSSSSRPWKYDVFLSFYGEDTRMNFTDHLFTALNRDGVQTFRDNEELEKGEDIYSKLMDAIESSRIAIIVLSKNYASSTWCLKELVKILDCKKNGQTVLPVFYKVDPSDVRHQKNTFAEAFMRHEECFKKDMEVMVKWKAALTETANLSGWDQCNVANGHEAELIKEIVEKVLTIVNQTHLYVAAYPVGLDFHIESIGSLLNDRLDVVRIIGIYGFGGVGKTTIAKAIFNIMFQNFEGSSFLANVREVSSQPNGLVLLQTQLLSDVLKTKEIEISNEDRGITIIQRRLCCKRVLIILDDVDKMKQFDKLVGEHHWFGPGSRIIITSRDEHLLNRPEVDEKYKVETMNQNDSLQLFSYHAFRQNHPLEGYVELSIQVVDHAGGLPLALVILGSLLLDKRSQVEWENELEKLKKIPNGEILEVLEISYNALDDFYKTMFLDISCFFIAMDKDNAIAILDACGLCPKSGITLLVNRSLVTIDKDNRLRMHDLIQEMGREIVRKQSPRNPGERSRLWRHEDALEVLTNLTGTSAVEGLKLVNDGYKFIGMKDEYKCLGPVGLEYFTSLDREIEGAGFDFSMLGNLRLTTKAFLKMPNLRFLEIDGPITEYIHWKHSHFFWEWNNKHSHFHRTCFKELLWVCWKGFPFQRIPNNFDIGKVVVLDMQHSNLKKVWKGTKILPNLKVLNLSHSHYLKCTPDFSGLLNLEKLILFDCERLVEVHENIDQLSKLVELDLKNCRELRNLPNGIGKLVSLEKLDINSCSKLENLPERIGNLTRLRRLDVFGTAIQELPSSIELLTNLITFSYSASENLRYAFLLSGRQRHAISVARLSASLYGFHFLKDLDLQNRNLTDDDIPDDLWKLYSLKSLNLSGNNFTRLPSSIYQLSELETMRLYNCKSLQSLPMLPSSLRFLRMEYCTSLERLPDLSNLKHLTELNLLCCLKLHEIEGIEGLELLKAIMLLGCNNLESSFKERLFEMLLRDCGERTNTCSIIVRGREIPEWFPYELEPRGLPGQALQIANEIFVRGLIICIVCDSPSNYLFFDGSVHITVVVYNISKGFEWTHFFHGTDELARMMGNHIWGIKIPLCEWESIAEPGDLIQIYVREPHFVKTYGVFPLFYDEVYQETLGALSAQGIVIF